MFIKFVSTKKCDLHKSSRKGRFYLNLYLNKAGNAVESPKNTIHKKDLNEMKVWGN